MDLKQNFFVIKKSSDQIARSSAQSKKYESHRTSWSLGYAHIRSVLELEPTAYSLPSGWNSAQRTACTSSRAVTATNFGRPEPLLPLLASRSGLGSCYNEKVQKTIS